MSAQGLNSSSYRGFRFVAPAGTTGAGIIGSFPTRDASDYTRKLKESSIAREYERKVVASGSRTPYNNPYVIPVDYKNVQSNQTRLSYNFGVIDCRTCLGPLPSGPVGS